MSRNWRSWQLLWIQSGYKSKKAQRLRGAIRAATKMLIFFYQHSPRIFINLDYALIN